MDDVIAGPHPLRVDDKSTAEAVNKQDSSIPKESKKPRTRIPTRLRQAVEKLQHGGVDRGAGDPQAAQQVPQHQPRRSSIPKLQKKDTNQSVKSKADPKTDKPVEVANKDLDIPKAEEEFEKIYDEIIEDKSIEYMDAIILPDSKIDTELETNFEDIIHAYDEGKIAPLHEENIKTDSQKSRIPLIKQKSCDEGKGNKNIVKTISLEEKVNNIVYFNDKMPIEQPVHGKGTKEVTKENELTENKHRKLSNSDKQLQPKNNEIHKSTVSSLGTKLEENFDTKPKVINQEKKQSDWFKPIDLKEHSPSNKPEINYSRRDSRCTSLPQEDKISPDATKIETEEKITIQSIGNGDTEIAKHPEKNWNEVENVPQQAITEVITDSVIQTSPDIRPASKDIIENLAHDKVQPNPEIFNNMPQEITKSESEEEKVPVPKGNVNRLISKISQVDSNGVQREHDGKKIEEEELPKPKSVLTKIAMFETIEPQRPKPRLPHVIKPKTKKTDQSPRIETVRYEVVTLNDDRKPRIIEEVLKAPPVRRKTHEYENNAQEFRPEAAADIKAEPKVNVADQNGTTFGPNIIHTGEKTKIATNRVTSSLENLRIDSVKNEKHIDNIDNNTSDKSKHFKTENETKPAENYPPLGKTSFAHDKTSTDFNFKPNAKVDRLPDTDRHEHAQRENLIENRLRRLKSSTESDNTKLERSKSIVEIEIGKSVKGKVFNIIQSMKSSELLETPKKEVISIKERPRKKSVSEKIALFERKMTPISMEEVQSEPEMGPGLERDIKNTDDAGNKILEEEALKIKIAELTGAKAKYGSVSEMPTFELSNGMKMPVLAVGTALLEPALVKPIVSVAIELGYRAIDTAYIYGNEQLVGEAIRAKIEDGTVKRSDLFIMSKLWSTYHRPDLVEKACRASLDRMGLDYFDLYMIHNPMSFKEDGEALPTIAGVLQFSAYEYTDAWAPLEGILDQGLVRSLGVANFNSEQVARVIGKAARKPVVNQVECHPYLSQQRLSDFCAGHGVRLTCYGTLGSRGTPAAYKTAGAASALDEPAVKEMAAQAGVSPAEILIRYQLDRGHGVVAKASTAVHLWQNLQALRVRLSPQQMDTLQALNKNRRNFSFKGMGDTHKNYPFNIPF